MNRLASNGETTAPCGVPLSRLVREPSGRRNGAFNHLSTYSRTHFWSSCTWCATALTMRSHGTVSKNFVISRSITQSFLKHRSRHTATASRGPRPGPVSYTHLRAHETVLDLVC